MELSNKAKNFMMDTVNYGDLSKKATILGMDTFIEILPFLCSERIREDLEVPEPGELTPALEGTLELARMLNITEEYITELYKKYLKSFL